MANAKQLEILKQGVARQFQLRLRALEQPHR